MAAPQPPPAAHFTIAVEPNRTRVTVIPKGDLDLASEPKLETELRRLRRVGFDHIVIDLRELTFLDSTGLSLLMTLRNDAKRYGHRLEVVPGVRHVQRVFEVTGTVALFDWRVEGRAALARGLLGEGALRSRVEAAPRTGGRSAFGIDSRKAPRALGAPQNRG